jgi:hypothetical protein
LRVKTATGQGGFRGITGFLIGGLIEPVARLKTEVWPTKKILPPVRFRKILPNKIQPANTGVGVRVAAMSCTMRNASFAARVAIIS